MYGTSILNIFSTGPHPQSHEPQIIKIGGVYYTPLLPTGVTSSDLLGAGSAALHVVNPSRGYLYQPPRVGYTYPVPTTTTTTTTTTTPLPPLAEENPIEPEEEYVPQPPISVSPDRDYVRPTTQAPIGLEFEQDIEAEGILPERPPRPVMDRPDFEIKRGETGNSVKGK